MKTSKFIALVMFGGTGERFGGDEPKQFHDCGGQPLMAETLSNIADMPCIDEIYVITHPDYLDETASIIDEYLPSCNRIYGVIPGGETRHESVENALGYLEAKGEDPNTIVAIFDGDRPGIEEEIVENNLFQAQAVGACVTALPSTDSVFSSQDGEIVDAYLDRKTIFLAQTPQTFRLDIILRAYAECQNPTTDDASLVSALGERVAIVTGSRNNDKITYPEDLRSYLARKGR